MKLTEYIETSARELKPNSDVYLWDYIGKFKETAQADWQTKTLSAKQSPQLLLNAAKKLLKSQAFDIRKADHRSIIATLKETVPTHDPILQGFKLHEPLRLKFEVKIVCDKDERTIATSQHLPTWQREFTKEIEKEIEREVPFVKRLANVADGGYERNPILGPEDTLKGPFLGNLRDYSGCASLKELTALYNGVLPLGRYVNPNGTENGQQSRQLFLNRFESTNARMEYNGIMICAPQNSGKTELIKRWARAANLKGYSLFIIDVKGNLKKKLGPLQGKTYYFSTDPNEPSDRVNFLSDLKATDIDKISQLATAILPSEGWESGKDHFHYQNRLIWLGAIIHILKLYEHYYFDNKEHLNGQPVDLSDLYNLVAREDYLLDTIRAVEWAEGKKIKQIPCSVYPWLTKISLLLSERDHTLGKRGPEDTFPEYTQGMIVALEPFASNDGLGTLYPKIRSKGQKGTLFDFNLLGSAEQVTIILSAREQDLEKAVTVLSMTIKKLQNMLFDRFRQDEPRPLLLLLDETRRIRSFRPNEYVTFAREAKAGCVLVYQSLDQIGEERAVMELLENIGTQVYLRTLVGNTARFFQSVLPKRFRTNFSISTSFGESGPSSTVQTGQVLDDYFSTFDLYRLPGGTWTSLIYIRDLGQGKPFIVDMEERKSTTPNNDQKADKGLAESTDRWWQN
ncbi:MAG: hypothetical protein SFV17_18680 [Candidatus Obscuribacter sp.]|nr:hypothetical protein [Candidatus Obscuribacter sp.]